MLCNYYCECTCNAHQGCQMKILIKSQIVLKRGQKMSIDCLKARKKLFLRNYHAFVTKKPFNYNNTV